FALGRITNRRRPLVGGATPDTNSAANRCRPFPVGRRPRQRPDPPGHRPEPQPRRALAPHLDRALRGCSPPPPPPRSEPFTATPPARGAGRPRGAGAAATPGGSRSAAAPATPPA